VWRGAVRITGADFAALANRFEQDDAVEGSATVTGVWSGEQFRIDRQALPRPRSAWVNPWVTPPCSPPLGGWPQVNRRGDILLDYDLGGLQDTGAAVAVTLFRPSEDQAVLVVAASDQAAVEARLRPQLGVLLCVVPSPWTKAQLDEIRDYLRERHEQWQLYQHGPQHTEDGQARVAIRLVRVLPEIADWADSLPHGIVVIDPWLAPSSRHRIRGRRGQLLYRRRQRPDPGGNGLTAATPGFVIVPGSMIGPGSCRGAWCRSPTTAGLALASPGAGRAARANSSRLAPDSPRV
jgi:hypothetical protein